MSDKKNDDNSGSGQQDLSASQNDSCGEFIEGSQFGRKLSTRSLDVLKKTSVAASSAPKDGGAAGGAAGGEKKKEEADDFFGEVLKEEDDGKKK